MGKAEYAIGNLREQKGFSDIRGQNSRLRKECYECVFLPKCFGGCASNEEAGESPCMIEKYMIQAYLEFL